MTWRGLAATMSNTNVRVFGCGRGGAGLGAWPGHGLGCPHQFVCGRRPPMSLFSTPKQLARLQRVLFMCLRLPFSQGAIPGRVLEEVLAEVRSGRVLPTYDFVDVVSAKEACGWQVKSTRAATPVTWKRAKLPNAAELIEASMTSKAACQELGDAVIGLCNEHAQASLGDYELEEIGYARLILHPDGQVTYFEKLLCSSSKPHIFDPANFSWHWSDPKQTVTKEQLPALQSGGRAVPKKGRAATPSLRGSCARTWPCTSVRHRCRPARRTRRFSGQPRCRRNRRKSPAPSMSLLPLLPPSLQACVQAGVAAPGCRQTSDRVGSQADTV